MTQPPAWPDEGREPVVIDDANGYEINVCMVDGSDEGPIFTIDGGMTLPQLHRVTYLLTRLMARGVTVQTTATWALDERQGRVRE